VTYPPAYPLASSDATRSACKQGGSRSATATKDSRSSSPFNTRLSARKLAEIESRLSDRDREVVALVSRFRVMSGGQLQRLFWSEGSPQTRARLARHGLSRLCEVGVLAPLARTVGGVRGGSRGRCFALGLAGQRLAASRSPKPQPRRPYTPGVRYLAHLLAIGELYVDLIEAQRWGSIEILSFDTEPACWRPYLGPWGARLVLKPDGYLKLGVGEYAYSWLIECDMATESLATIERKARRHLDYHHSGSELRHRGVTPRVAWIVPDATRAEGIDGVLQRLRPDERKLFAVATYADALSLLPTGVWS
jgi:protein involved in plasmid replication-relaxation